MGVYVFLRPWDDTSKPLLLQAPECTQWELCFEAADISLLSVEMQSPSPGFICSLYGEGTMIW